MMDGGNKQSPPLVEPTVARMEEDEFNDGCATPEELEPVNRIKAPPVCVDVSLRQESMTTEILQQWIFPEETNFPFVGTQRESNQAFSSTLMVTSSSTSEANLFPLETAYSSTASSTHIPVSVISISSNNSSGDSYTLSSDETSEVKSISEAGASNLYIQPPQLNRDASERLNAKILLRKTSRQGRSSQRWVSGASSVAKVNIVDHIAHSPLPKGAAGLDVATVPNYDPVIRLVTGCVPILQSGKILFVSASRKAAWILPKGGWEQDESMEESAIRECYEEAGCIGTLGPALSSIQYETRKAKKRRVENESLSETERKAHQLAEGWVDKPKLDADESVAVFTASTIDGHSKNSNTIFHENNSVDVLSSNEPMATASASPVPGALNSETVTRIRQLTQSYSMGGHQTDTESMSAGSTLSAAYTHVQMTLFPLYVQKIEENWPENGRFRKAVAIDDAIKMMEERPELQAALIEVRDRKLHIVPVAQTATDA
jgi:8-oxo-dGTP pyrophosphatase MutT (NUDIX family)